MITPPFAFSPPSWRAKAFMLALSQATKYEKEWVYEAAAKLNQQDWENSVFTFSDVVDMAVVPDSNMQTLLNNLRQPQLPMLSSRAISANLIQWATWFSGVARDDRFKLSQYLFKNQGSVILNIQDTKEHVYLNSEEGRILCDPNQKIRSIGYAIWQWSWGGTILDGDLPPSGMKEQMLIARIFKNHQTRSRFKKKSVSDKSPQLVQELLDLKRYWEVVPAYEALAHLSLAFKDIAHHHKNDHSLKPKNHEEDFNKIKKLCHQRGAMNMLKLVSGDDIASKALALDCTADVEYRERLTNLGLLPIEKSAPLMLYPELNGKRFVYSFDLLFNEVSYQTQFLESFSDEQVKIVLQRWLEENSCSKMQDFVNAHAARLTPEILSSINAEKTMPLLTVLKNNKLAGSEKIRLVTTLLERGANPNADMGGCTVVDYAQKFSKHSVCVPILKEYALRIIVEQNKPFSLEVRPKFKI